MNFCVLGGAWANIGLRTRYPDPQSMLSARAVRSITENPVTLAKGSPHAASMFFETFVVWPHQGPVSHSCEAVRGAVCPMQRCCIGHNKSMRWWEVMVGRW